MRRVLPLIAVAGVAGIAGVAAYVILDGSSSHAAPQPPEAFMSRVLELTVDERYDEAWTFLHPGHQQLVPRQRFVRCRESDPTIAGYRFVSASFVSKRYVPIESPGIPQHTSTEVVLRFRIAERTSGRTLPAEEATVRAVWIDRRWAWVIPERELPTFRAGRCPS